MRRRNEIVQELEELDGVLNLFHAEPPATTSAEWITFSSLQRRREALDAELAAASVGSLKVILDGDAVVEGAADVEHLIRTLAPLQNALASIGAALEGAATTAGQIAEDIRSRTRLRLVGTFAGSFGLDLVGPKVDDDTQLLLFDEEMPLPLLDRSVGTVLDIITAAGQADDPEQAIVEHVADLGQRATSHFKALSDAIIRSTAPTRLEWTPPDSPDVRAVVFNGVMAERLKAVLDVTETVEAEVAVSGVLEAADKLARTFKIVTDDGAVIGGRVDSAIIDRLRDYFDRHVNATMLARTSSMAAAGKKATKFTLVRFAGELGE